MYCTVSIGSDCIVQYVSDCIVIVLVLLGVLVRRVEG